METQKGEANIVSNMRDHFQKLMGGDQFHISPSSSTSVSSSNEYSCTIEKVSMNIQTIYTQKQHQQSLSIDIVLACMLMENLDPFNNLLW
jgi:hypothetical protein